MTPFIFLDSASRPWRVAPHGKDELWIWYWSNDYRFVPLKRLAGDVPASWMGPNFSPEESAMYEALHERGNDA